MEWSVGDEAIREFKIRWLRTTTTDKHATAHDQNHVTVHFSRVVLRLRWVVELFRVVGTKENILLVFCRLGNSRISSFRRKVFNSPSFPNTVSYAILGNFSLTLQHLGNLWDPIGHQELLTQPLPREADDFSCGSKYNKDVSLPTYLDYYVVTITITIVVV